ncbi:MAG: DUF1178 family protein [Betaproteobacteria bacterium]|jgi:hypothetical protein|nr:DUF1178 family protein [Betaproteobacteria bacterium]
MKVLDLQCQHHHSFEGWFASEDDFQSQNTRSLVECPLCGDHQITKMLSAPRLNLSGASQASSDEAQDAQQPSTALATTASSAAVMPLEAQQAWLQMVQHVLAHTEDVGGQFAQEARKMHYGETPERAIRGQVSKEETSALLEEGIQVMPLPMPAAIKGPVQ